jgi:ethanolamine utilization protein EutN
MIIGKVIGTVTTSIKHSILEGRKLLVVRPVSPAPAGKKAKSKPAGEEYIYTGKAVVALDTVQAGVGDTVLVIDEGNSGRLMIGDSSAPVRTVIAGIIDSVKLEALNGR